MVHGNANFVVITSLSILVIYTTEPQAARLMASSKMAVKNEPQAARLIARKKGSKIDGRLE